MSAQADLQAESFKKSGGSTALFTVRMRSINCSQFAYLSFIDSTTTRKAALVHSITSPENEMSVMQGKSGSRPISVLSGRSLFKKLFS